MSLTTLAISLMVEALEAMMPEVDDFFELETDEGEDAASYLDPGAWARTPAKPVRLGGAPRAVLHLVLRDGDAMFASERQPWAEVTVNGRAVKPPVRVREDDEVALGVRAPTEAEICGGNTQDFPAFNSGILVEDVRFNGVSLITNNLSDVPLIVDATETGERWKLNGIVADVVEDTWQGILTLVDTCGYETEALVRVRDCVVPNVFTPDASGDNDNFRIRGLDGYMGSRLMIYNRYGTIVFQDETATDTEFELVWNGRYDNGNDAPEGTYQWVLIRADGMKEAGQLTLLRQD